MMGGGESQVEIINIITIPPPQYILILDITIHSIKQNSMTIKKVKRNLIITIPLKQLNKLLEEVIKTSPEPQNEPTVSELLEDVVLPDTPDTSEVQEATQEVQEVQELTQGETNEPKETDNTTGASI
jgi:hypothetical protein